MKKILTLAFLLCSFGVLAQNTVTIPFNGVPTGTCAFVMMAADVTNGNNYLCNPLTHAWYQIGSGSTPVTPSGTLAINHLVLGGGTTVVKTDSACLTDGAGAMSGCISVSAGTAPTACGSATGCFGATAASTASTQTSGQGSIRLDTSVWKLRQTNGAAEIQIATYADTLAAFGAGALANGTTATTQSANDNSTKVATTAYVDAKAGFNPADSTIVEFRWDWCGGVQPNGSGPSAMPWTSSLLASGTVAGVASSAFPAWPDFCGMRATTAASANSGWALTGGDTPALGKYLFPPLGANAGWETSIRFSIGQTTTTHLYLGFVTTYTGTTTAPSNFIGIRYDTSLGTPDAAFTFVGGLATADKFACTAPVCGITVDTNPHTLHIKSTTGGELRFWLDSNSANVVCITNSGSSPGCAGGNVTSATQITTTLDPFVQYFTTNSGANQTFTLYNWYFYASGLSR